MNDRPSPEEPLYVQAARTAALGVAIVRVLLSCATRAPTRPLTVFVARSLQLAPIVTLLDIPALTQRWYTNEAGVPQADPVASIALSAVSLAFCFIGNILMMIKFSSYSPALEKVSWLVPQGFPAVP